MIPSSPLAFLALQAAGGLDMLQAFAPMVIIFAIFYVLLVLPMRKRQKALQQTIENLKKGDKVVTTGGLYGEVAGIDATTLILKVADNVKVRVAKSAVAGLEAEGGGAGGAGDKAK
jgi:preprotein translocase subunit YajC